MNHSEVRRLRATFDGTLGARLVRVRPLEAAGDGGVFGRVRAGSGVRRWGDHLVIIQDDMRALATIRAGDASGDHPISGVCQHPIETDPAIATPPTPIGGLADDKRAKLDLESCFVLPDGRFVALGSGSTSKREHAVVWRAPGERPRTVELARFFASLREDESFAGAELNLEGAVTDGARLLLFQRGNGSARTGVGPVNAEAAFDLAEFVAHLDGSPHVPTARSICVWDLGMIGRARLGFTDAVWVPGEGIAYLACAEDSPDTYGDGENLGCVFGRIGPDGARQCEVLEPDGTPTRAKYEGIELGSRAGEFHVVSDLDSPDQPARIATLRATGWR